MSETLSIHGQTLARDNNAISIIIDRERNFHSLSTTEIVINGMPLTLYEDTGKNLSLAVSFQDISSPDQRKSFFVEGEFLKMVRVGEETFFPLSEDLVADAPRTGEFIWYGIPLSINANNNLIITRILNRGFDETAEVMIGGMPITCRRIGSKWVLVACRFRHGQTDPVPFPDFDAIVGQTI